MSVVTTSRKTLGKLAALHSLALVKKPMITPKTTLQLRKSVSPQTVRGFKRFSDLDVGSKTPRNELNSSFGRRGNSAEVS